MASKNQPLMHPVQLAQLKAFIRTEIEFAFSVENGGRYGRRELRDRMRGIERVLTQLLCETPMEQFGLGSEGANEDAHMEQTLNEDDEDDDDDDDDEEGEGEGEEVPVEKVRQMSIRLGTKTGRIILRREEDEDDEPTPEVSTL